MKLSLKNQVILGVLIMPLRLISRLETSIANNTGGANEICDEIVNGITQILNTFIQKGEPKLKQHEVVVGLSQLMMSNGRSNLPDALFQVKVNCTEHMIELSKSLGIPYELFKKKIESFHLTF